MILLIDEPRCGLDSIIKDEHFLYPHFTFSKSENLNKSITAIYCEFSKKLDRSFLEQFPNLNLIASSTTSLTHVDLNYCEQNQIQIISLRNFPEVIQGFSATVEVAIWHLIELARSVSSSVASVRSGLWNRNEFIGETLANTTLGILGFGRLGRKMARICEAFGMRILVHDLKHSSDGLWNCPYEIVESIDALFSLSDAVSIHVDDRKENLALINRSVLSRVTSSRFTLINTSRGFIVDEKDIVESLRSGTLHGYAADVLHGEEYTHEAVEWLESSLIYKAFVEEELNISLSPHIGGATTFTMSLASRTIMKELLARYRSKLNL